MPGDPTRRRQTWLPATSLCDILIVGFTLYYLINFQRATGSLQQTNKLLTRAMLVLETGLPDAILSVLDLFLFKQCKGTNFHLALCFGLSKVYSNCILLILNWRAYIERRHPDNVNVVDTGIVFGDRKTTTATAMAGTMNFEIAGDVEANRSPVSSGQN